MTRSRAVLLVTVAGVVLLVVLEASKEAIGHLLHLDDGSVVRAEVGGVLLLVLLIINLMFHLSAAQAEESVDQVTSQLSLLRSGGRLSVLTSTELYRELVEAASVARHRVYNTYLGHAPPPASNLPEKADYFKVLAKLARRRKGVSFRRIVLLTEATAKWIAGLMDEYAGMRNVSLAVYRKGDGLLPPLSIQLFDDNKVFVVHAAARPPGQPRDIMITDPVVVSLLDDYYKEVWELSEVVLDSGSADGAKLQRLIAGLESPRPPG
jgi:hypothetical protein